MAENGDSWGGSIGVLDWLQGGVIGVAHWVREANAGQLCEDVREYGRWSHGRSRLVKLSGIHKLVGGFVAASAETVEVVHNKGRPETRFDCKGKIGL